MNIATTATQVAEVDNSVDLLEGWDTVFAIRYADVNSAIVKAESSPPGFDATITDDLLQMLMPKGDWGESATAVGTFGDWALAPGGAGHKIQMTLPVPTVTLTRPGHPDVTRTDVTFSIEVELAPISRGKNSGADGGELFDFKLLAPQGAGDYTITVTDCSYQGSDQDQINRAFLIAIMTVWLNDNTAQFDHTFATVNLNAKAAHDKFDWLMPTTTSYAVNDQGTMESGIFGVLCMTENRAPSKNQQIMTEALPPEQRSSFLISRERFMSKMIGGTIGDMFTGPQKPEEGKVWPQDYFDLVDNDTSISNNAPLYIKDFDVGKEGKPELVDAKLATAGITCKLEETYLNVRIQNFTHPYYWWLGDWYLKVHHTIETRNTAYINEHQQFAMMPLSSKIGDKAMEHTAVAEKTEHAKYIEWAEIFIGLLALGIPLARAGWLRYFAEVPEEIEIGAAATATVEAEGVPQAGQAAELEAEGATGALAWLRNRLTGLRDWVAAMSQNNYARVVFGMSALLTTEQILQAIADGGAPEKLPKYREFAATVMSPIQWPEAAEFEVTGVQFNGSLQSFGDPGFTF